MLNNKGFSNILIIFITLIVLGVLGYFVFNYFKKPLGALPITKFEDPRKRFTFEYNKLYNFSNESTELETSYPLRLSRDVSLKTGEKLIYQIEISIDTNKTDKSSTDLYYIKEFENYSLVIEAKIQAYDSEENYRVDFPIPDENLKEIYSLDFLF